MKVAVEVEVDLFRGLDLGAAAAGCAAFHPEDRAERGFTRGEDGALADVLEALNEADGRDGLAFSGDGGGRGCYQNEFAAAVEAWIVEKIETELGADRTALFIQVVGQLELGGDGFNRQQVFLHASSQAASLGKPPKARISGSPVGAPDQFFKKSRDLKGGRGGFSP